MEAPEVCSGAYAAGDLIAGKYRLVRQLGEGGMGTVWLAQNQALDVRVAIKLLKSDDDSQHWAGRLTQEARAAAKLGHPAIMRVFDFGRTEADDPFIVMELLRGEDLAAALRRKGCLSETKAVQTILPLVHALTVAHERGIVHRDLKPENVFLAQTDAGGIQPKLVDFGIAKLDPKGFDRLTRSGALLGSPAYMSPEQARGEDVDHGADIWAVGVVLYEMITGAPPFGGDNYNALLWAILRDDPEPTSTQVGGDPELWGILERGFQKEPHRRWPSMPDLGKALARWLLNRGVREDIAGRSLKTTWLERRRSGADFLTSLPPPGARDLNGYPLPGAQKIPDVAPAVRVAPAVLAELPSPVPAPKAPSDAASRPPQHQQQTPSATKPDRPRRWRVPLAAVASAALVGGAVGGGGLLWWTHLGQQSEAPAVFPAASIAPAVATLPPGPSAMVRPHPPSREGLQAETSTSPAAAASAAPSASAVSSSAPTASGTSQRLRPLPTRRVHQPRPGSRAWKLKNPFQTHGKRH